MKKKKITFSGISDMPEVAIAEGSMMVNKTGSWRYLRPVYREKLAPCRKGCPLGTDIPRVISLITQEKFREAWELIVETNPIPAITGHACYHSCENSCTRIALDDRVGVQALERFLSDREIESEFPYKPSPENGRKVAVIGSGPAGLGAAWSLVRNGCQADVFEKGAEAGGMLRSTIPSYKLSREILDREIRRLEDFGVNFKLGTEIGKDITLQQLDMDYDAVIIATGIPSRGERLFPDESAPLAYRGLDFLSLGNSRKKPETGREVIVVGHGNTAVDAARCARRLGSSVKILTLCSRPEVSATNQEVKAAEAEDIELLCQSEIVSMEIKSGRVVLDMIGLASPPEGEETPPEDPYIPGSEFSLTADTVIDAREGISAFSEEFSAFLERDNVFAAGDALIGSSSISHALRSGVEAAFRLIDASRESEDPREKMQLFNLMGMNRDCFGKASQVELPVRVLPEGLLDFNEITETISAEDAVYEAGRCVSCGVCNFCDTCMTFCPDFCISRTPDGYEVDLDYCKGCGICVQECPRDVIDLVQEGS